MKDFNHSIDLRRCVVKVETRASCARDTKPPHERLVAVMSAAHGQAVLIGERGQIVGMCRIHHKPNQRAALFVWAKNARSRQFRESLGCVTREM